MASPSTGFVRVTPETAGPCTPFSDYTVKPRENIFEAALWNDVEAIKHFVEVENVPVNATNALNQTAAHIVVSRFSSQVALDILLNRDPSLVSMKDKWGQTILHIAIKHGCTELMEYLVDTRDADIYQPIDGRFGQTAIHLAAEENRLPIMIYFVEQKRCDVNVRNLLGEPPIFSAAAYNHVNMVEYLMSKGADVKLRDKNDENILFVCAKGGDLAVTKYLLEERKIPFNIDFRNNQGETILHAAVKYERLDFIKYLVENTKIDKDIYENLDRTALYVATLMGNLEIIRYLVEHGANHNLDDIDARVPLEVAVHEPVKKYLSGLAPRKPRHRRDAFSSYVYTFEGERAGISARSRELPARSSTTSDSARLTDLGSFHFDRFLVLADVCFRYLAHSGRQAVNDGQPSFLSPTQIVRNKIDPIAVDVIEAEIPYPYT